MRNTDGDALIRWLRAYRTPNIAAWDLQQNLIAFLETGKFDAGQKTGERPQEMEPAAWRKISPAGIYECSGCGIFVMTDDIDCYRFCHGCGRRMRPE